MSKEDKFIHKETFFQPADEGMPSTWVVQYWIDDPSGFCEAKYLKTKEEAEAFKEENDMWEYDDWLGSQEIPLSVQ